MILMSPDKITEIDTYAAQILGIPTQTLMRRAGEAVANAVRSIAANGERICIFAGKGNNGGDGYAAALHLIYDYDVVVYDVFSAGQRSDEGRYFLNEYVRAGGVIKELAIDAKPDEILLDFDCFIDAIFGTGFSGATPERAVMISEILRNRKDKKAIAIDVPLGVNATDGSVCESSVYHADITVVLGFIKPGLVSYPAKEYVGKLIYDNIGLHNDEIIRQFSSNTYYLDRRLASSLVPVRAANSSKGSFGKLLLITGSESFRGAAHLSLEAALRSGVGYVTYIGEKTVIESLLSKFPEAIYKPIDACAATESALDMILAETHKNTATLIGSGSSQSEALLRLTERLLAEGSSPIVLDADAINVLSRDRDRSKNLIRSSARPVILTPHPLEFSRLSGLSTDYIQSHRLLVAKEFANEWGVTLVLKGAATVVTDGRLTYINSSGSSALAKAGSGDVLAGSLASLVASGVAPICACALAVYVHGIAADALAESFSELGVTPSDLSKEIARQICRLSIPEHSFD